MLHRAVFVCLILASVLLIAKACDLFDEEDSPTDDSGKLYDPSVEVDVSAEVITDELEVPWRMGFLPDDRILITERPGRVRVVANEQLEPEPWVDLSDSLKDSQGQKIRNAGVLGIAIHPEFEDNRYVYIGYTYDAPNQPYDFNRLVRYKDDPGSGQGEFDRVILEEVPGYSMHNSSTVKFGPDDKLYWGVGDRFNPETSQDLDTPSGSILRINPDGTIPEDNPFNDSYIFSWGHRNPQGFDWHPVTEKMFATEHGPSGGDDTERQCCLDEVNIVEKGNNYGYPVIKGDENAEGMEPPLIHSGHDEENVLEHTWAPSGAAFVHTGPWKGTFLFAGLRSQALWQVILDEDFRFLKLRDYFSDFDPEYREEDYFARIRSVNQSPNGAIYFLTSNRDRTDHPIGKDYLIRVHLKEQEQ